ncbi:MAG: hypothetical protein ACNI3A_04360 [Desulfovibrio sp.]|uniref:hypothetical protein n=1 Tax=Desulfovibrio sp. 7SRBS1 TaxID=3378064 RepID=UPI003B3F15CB
MKSHLYHQSATRLRCRREQLQSVSTRFTALLWAMSSYFDEHEDAVLDGLSEFMGDIDRDLRRLNDDVDRDVRDLGQSLFSGGARV